MNNQIIWDNARNPASNYVIPDIQMDALYQSVIGRKAIVIIGLRLGDIIGALLIPNDLVANNEVSYSSSIIDDIAKMDNCQTDIAFFKEESESVYLQKEGIQNSIDNFIALNNNWDGYGAIPLEVSSAQNARGFFDALPMDLLKHFQDGYPNTHGTISFEWENEREESFFLEIGNKNVSYYLMPASGKVIAKDNVLYNYEVEKHIISLLKRL